MDSIVERYLAAEAEYRAAQAAVKAHGGEFLKAARQQLGFTQRELAERLNLDFSFISKVENGHAPISKNLIRGVLALLKEE